MRAILPAALPAAALLALAAASCAPHPVAPHAATGGDESALRAAFNAAADRPRLVLLLSPT